MHELSNKSKTFIEDLRVYLFSSGKKSKEIEAIIEELETHLIEAEKRGKPIEKIVGNSPKEYMQMIADEMKIDLRSWLKYIFMIIVGSFSFTIFKDALAGAGSLSYSILEIIGHIVIAGIFIVTLFLAFRYIASHYLSNLNQFLLLLIVTLVPIGLYVGLIFLNRSVETPVMEIGQTGTMIITGIMVLFIICLSIWAKTAILIAIVALLVLPDYLLSKTALDAEMQLIASNIILIVGIGIYVWINNLKYKHS
ncbi:hypothetical protein H8S33_15025 [Ornithinibacillus sp. BX22]|uniref:HAAS transmembrane region domain-containing protein n=2 Tax=Ornithinibacillus TaxID=484508 RepID=A0A923RKC2_9BACI|nr:MULTISPECIES: hypothetical protein [Ornithinibacillus]MBC5638108.1 hypothetical protein [Ornithinibacillus hominis]MBS3680821.1 hypothetical protein [Ornithinibacillus massiliensis]